MPITSGGMHDAHPRIVEIEPLFRALRLQNRLIAHQIEVLQLRVIPQGIDGSSDIHGGGVVPAHGVQGDFHVGLEMRVRR